MGFALHQHELASGVHLSPVSWTFLPLPLQPYCSGLSQSTGFRLVPLKMQEDFPLNYDQTGCESKECSNLLGGQGRIKARAGTEGDKLKIPLRLQYKGRSHRFWCQIILSSWPVHSLLALCVLHNPQLPICEMLIAISMRELMKIKQMTKK